MPSRYVRARELTLESLQLAVLPVVLSVVAVNNIQRALQSPPGFGVTFPLPSAAGDLWTYTNVPGGLGSLTGSPALTAGTVAGTVVGVVVAGAAQAGLLGTLAGRLDGDRISRERVLLAVGRFAPRLVGIAVVQLLAVVVIVIVGRVFLPLAVVCSLAVGYLLYGWPFVVVVRDESLTDTLGVTLGLATEAGAYLRFGLGHAVAGAVLSVPLTWLVRNGGMTGVLLGSLLVAVPSLFVASYGLVLFRELARPGAAPSGVSEA